MHFEILVEDVSGKAALDVLVPKIIGSDNTFRVISYNGIGHITNNMKSKTEANKRILLDQLPRLLQGYGKKFNKTNYHGAVIVVCDLDDKCLKAFREELLGVLNNCNPKPKAVFCIAVEEMEAWLLGDLPAIKKVYPKAKDKELCKYKNDSICGTSERLADAVFAGGAEQLKATHGVGAEKSKWAITITPHMDVETNKSPSFCYFRDKLRSLTCNSA
ncbi:DUF4276 family protein [Candidatus Magnetominusculus dajiuhuensis]|uniref:DUF4276 family protein n=1 Tax=Candidatus Magnetominusculus dajiuhuensis TaxID=3137712 RepID=UPI003B431273